ncbi:MAG: SUMF1/EgtB/PvdO family nonheme iron enzyme, partial [Candidatus Puniceispirillaceae bacterium]
MSMRIFWVLFGLIVFNPAQADMAIRMDQTEVSIRAFAEFVAATGFQTKAELDGGMVYEAGWVVKPGWNWRQPYGTVSPPDEPAVHLTFDEAAAYCKWRGQRLPSRDEWISAAYT